MSVMFTSFAVKAKQKPLVQLLFSGGSAVWHYFAAGLKKPRVCCDKPSWFLVWGQRSQPLLKIVTVLVFECSCRSLWSLIIEHHSSSHLQARPCKCWQMLTDVPGLYYEERRGPQVSKQQKAKAHTDTPRHGLIQSMELDLNLSKTAHVEWLCFGKM